MLGFAVELSCSDLYTKWLLFSFWEKMVLLFKITVHILVQMSEQVTVKLQEPPLHVCDFLVAYLIKFA